jgi:ParB family chromosome partitioning protein
MDNIERLRYLNAMPSEREKVYDQLYAASLKYISERPEIEASTYKIMCAFWALRIKAEHNGKENLTFLTNGFNDHFIEYIAFLGPNHPCQTWANIIGTFFVGSLAFIKYTPPELLIAIEKYRISRVTLTEQERVKQKRQIETFLKMAKTIGIVEDEIKLPNKDDVWLEIEKIMENPLRFTMKGMDYEFLVPEHSNVLDDNHDGFMYTRRENYVNKEQILLKALNKYRWRKTIEKLREFNVSKVPCVIVNLDDAHVRLFAQALNHIHGDDDLGLRAELIREVLKTIPEQEVLTILPDTMVGLKGMATLGQEAVAGYLQNWEKARAVRLRNLLFKLTSEQLLTVEAAIEQILPEARRQQGVSPNSRGIALYLICKSYLEKEA